VRLNRYYRGACALTLAAIFTALAASAQTTQTQTTAAPSAHEIIPPAPTTPADQAAQRTLFEQDEKMLRDWPNLARYQAANAQLQPAAPGEKRVVFMGDSITEAWMNHGTGASEQNPGFFPGKPYVDRGISGQTTPQMLLRFRQDVLDLKPSVVVIFAGTNDIAGNTGPITAEQTEGNITSMAELAHANGIKVVLCSILPAYEFKWRPGREPGPKIVAINKWIKSYADANHYPYVDFHSAMADEHGGLPVKLSHDGVHPTADGYAIMNPLVEAGIKEALK
jgi:lysophospholipase L1-like esterase